MTTDTGTTKKTVEVQKPHGNQEVQVQDIRENGHDRGVALTDTELSKDSLPDEQSEDDEGMSADSPGGESDAPKRQSSELTNPEDKDSVVANSAEVEETGDSEETDTLTPESDLQTVAGKEADVDLVDEQVPLDEDETVDESVDHDDADVEASGDLTEEGGEVSGEVEADDTSEALTVNGVEVVAEDGVEITEKVLEELAQHEAEVDAAQAQAASEDLAKMSFFQRLREKIPFGKKEEGEQVGEEYFIPVTEIEEREREEQEREWPTEGVENLPHLRNFLHISHIESGERVVTTDNRKIVIFECQGMEIDYPNVASFAGALNSLQVPVQILIRQHQPRLNGFRMMMRSERSEELTDRMTSAAEALDLMLGKMETREGLMDRRFYIVCSEENRDEVVAGLSRVKLKFAPIADRALTIMLLSSILGQAPAELPDLDFFRMRETASGLKTNNGIYRRTIQLTVFPRNMTTGFLQGIFGMGIPMDMSIQIWPIPSEEAIRNLESQRTKMQASANAQLKKTGQVGSKETIAIEDIMRLRDAVMRGTERMFRSLLTVTVCANSEQQLNEYVGLIKSSFTSVLAQVNELNLVQRNAFLSSMPFCNNYLQDWTVVDTTTLALMFPFAPGDLDLRRGTLVGLDNRARSIITFDLFDPRSSQNMNTAILATSGAGKSFSAKLFLLRQMMRGVRVYVIDPEGEYVDTAIAAGGRVMTPGVPGSGMNPFLVTETGPELNERIGTLKRLLQVMINQRLDAVTLASLDNAMTSYYHLVTSTGTPGTFTGLYGYLDEKEPELAKMVTPFFSGSSKDLLSDEGLDLLSEEPPITVFNLRLVDEEMRAAAGMVCSETVWTMAARDPRPRMLVADEVWSILAHPEGAGFMINTAKRARKHKMGLMSITQDVQDLLTVNSSEGIRGNSGRALLQNASYKLLLRQDPASIPSIQDTFKLPSDVAERLAGYATGEGLLVSPSGFFPITIEAAPEEAEIIEWTPGLH